jgi:cytochrome c biogenesis protein CcmG/thiol:disulfide interchange protein DsbE
MKQTRKIASLTVLLLTVLAFNTCTKRPQPISDASGWTTTENQRGKLSDYKGKVVVLDFYATWCEPCRAETPHLVAMQHRYGAQGLQVVGLNVGGQDDHAQVPAYAKEFSIQYPLVLPDDELVDTFLNDNQNIPQAFVFDRNGDVVKRFVGYSDESGAEMERIVRAILDSKSPQASQ